MAVGTGSRAPSGTADSRCDHVRLGRELVDRGDDRLGEAVAVERDPHLRPRSASAFDHAEREVVEQLVGQDHAVERHRRELVERGDDRSHADDRERGVVLVAHDRAEGVLERLDREQLMLLGAERRRPLDEHVAQRARAVGRGAEHVACQAPTAGPGLDHEVGIRFRELTPPSVERAGHQRAEQRADLGAGDEVAAGAAGAARPGEEPVGAVERELHERIERDRPLPPDPLRQLLVDPVHRVIMREIDRRRAIARRFGGERCGCAVRAGRRARRSGRRSAGTRRRRP